MESKRLVRGAAVTLWAVAVAGMVFAACNRVPYTGRRTLVLLSWGSEVQLGADAYTEILAAEKEVTRGANYESVKDVGSRVSRKTPQQFRSLDWQFKLLESDAVNAFALPGGNVAIYNGILPVLANEGGMSSVVGHEIGHVVARHGAERISGTMLLQLGLSAADVALSNSQIHDDLMGLLGLGATVGVVLPFSRANELESDYLGGIFMAKAGYDPAESVKVWERMTEAAGGDNPLPFLSTHPSNKKRIERLSEEMPTFRTHYDKAKNKRGKGKTLR